jgi:hypothetical protein
VDEALYAVTTRHVLFPEDEGNDPYFYEGGPKKEVVLMGTKAFENFLKSIEGHLGRLHMTVDDLEEQIAAFTARSEADLSNPEQVASKLERAQHQLNKIRMAIQEVKRFFVEIKKQWTKPKDRIIGHVVWAPPISFSTAPHGYTKDVCVIKLDEKKFSRNFRGNVLDLGPEIEPLDFKDLMYPRIQAASDFRYPANRLLKLRGILSAEEIRNPNNKDHTGKHVRYVIKRGLITLTTVGCLTGFESHVRHYSTLGSRDTVEAAVHRHSLTGPFSKKGDSGSIIVDALGKFVALLTSGAGSTDFSDITFGSPMHWLWDIIKAEFPGANLYFEDYDT